MALDLSYTVSGEGLYTITVNGYLCSEGHYECLFYSKWISMLNKPYICMIHVKPQSLTVKSAQLVQL